MAPQRNLPCHSALKSASPRSVGSPGLSKPKSEADSVPPSEADSVSPNEAGSFILTAPAPVLAPGSTAPGPTTAQALEPPMHTLEDV